MSKRSTLIGLTTVFLAAATAGAQGTVIYACYVPGGNIYRIKVPGGKQECDSKQHVEFSWNDQGAKGDKGDPGAPGASGAKGDKGEPGTPGAKGDKGDPGTAGTAGASGAKGDKGDPGTPGLKGEKGEKGDKGDPGDDPGTLPTLTLTGATQLEGTMAFVQVSILGELLEPVTLNVNLEPIVGADRMVYAGAFGGGLSGTGAITLVPDGSHSRAFLLGFVTLQNNTVDPDEVALVSVSIDGKLIPRKGFAIVRLLDDDGGDVTSRATTNRPRISPPR